jgi:CRP-like cAMP-binding protein
MFPIYLSPSIIGFIYIYRLFSLFVLKLIRSISLSLSAKLTQNERVQLAALLVEKRFQAGDRILTQGELGLGFYIITKGEVVVTLKNEKGIVSELGRLKEGG